MKTADTPTRTTLAHALPLPTAGAVAAQLEDALADLTTQRAHFVAITEQYAEAKARLQVLEDLALLGGKIDGSNDTIRGAQLRQATEAQRTAFQRLDLQRVVASLGVEMALDRLKTYRALARLLAGERE